MSIMVFVVLKWYERMPHGCGGMLQAIHPKRERSPLLCSQIEKKVLVLTIRGMENAQYVHLVCLEYLCAPQKEISRERQGSVKKAEEYMASTSSHFVRVSVNLYEDSVIEP